MNTNRQRQFPDCLAPGYFLKFMHLLNKCSATQFVESYDVPFLAMTLTIIIKRNNNRMFLDIWYGVSKMGFKS